MSIQFLLALQLISDIVLFVAVILLLTIVGRNLWKKNTSPLDKQTVAELERLISASQAAANNLIKAMDESRRALKETVCEVEEKNFRRVSRDAAERKNGKPARLSAMAQHQPAAASTLPELRPEAKVPDEAGPARASNGEKGRGSGQDGTKANSGGDGGPGPAYKAVIEMARQGMSEKEIFEQSELTEAEISLVLELGRKRNEFN